jgi:hypothetical protein
MSEMTLHIDNLISFFVQVACMTVIESRKIISYETIIICILRKRDILL